MAYLIKHRDEGMAADRNDVRFKPRCDGQAAMADAIIALTANQAMRRNQRIEFKEEWFDASKPDVPDPDMRAEVGVKATSSTRRLRMTRREFWLTLEYRICHEFEGNGGSAPYLWCDGFTPVCSICSPTPRRRSSAEHGSSNGRKQEEWDFTFFLPTPAESVEFIEWRTLIPARGYRTATGSSIDCVKPIEIDQPRRCRLANGLKMGKAKTKPC